MWQLLALGGIFSTAFEGVIDKVALVSYAKVDSVVATFWRCFIYVLWMIPIGLLGMFGALSISFPPIIILVALGSILNSFFYTLLLRRVEITSIGGISYVAPLLFLFLDALILHTPFKISEILGIFFLVAGGLGFTIDRSTFRFKKEFSPVVWGILAYVIIYSGGQAYAFKYVHAQLGMNGVSFLTSYDLLVSAALFLIIALQGHLSLLWNGPARAYVPRMVASKFFDATSTIFFTQALTIAAVSQMSAMATLEPLAFLVVALAAQYIFGMRTSERFGGSNIAQKGIAVAALIIGGLLVG